MVLVRTSQNVSPRKEPAVESDVPLWLILGPILFFVGIAAGAVFSGYAKPETLEHLDILFQADSQLRMEESFFSGFISSVSSSFLLLFVCFLSGLSLWGTVVLPFIPVVRGMGLGLLASRLYTAFGTQGILHYLLAFLPGALLGSIGIFLAVQESWNFSKTLRVSGASQRSYGNYCMRMGLFLAPCIAGAFLDRLLTMALSMLSGI